MFKCSNVQMFKCSNVQIEFFKSLNPLNLWNVFEALIIEHFGSAIPGFSERP